MTPSGYYDEAAAGDLRARCDRTTENWPGVAHTTMFGCPSYTADGTLFAVVSTQGVALTRLPDAERERLAADHPVEPFEAGGRTVGRWAVVPPAAATACDLDRYLRASYEAARGE
ncbi:TfoX/Sxy family protein [Halobaculum lipolyticum]|uniref:TfoX/Sxy family protein n=1 Tax=Halobaculum lipolyticum TaxID=3032001 RepID=A0ABD5WCW9_9EURY|nr:TfoX/Sxy family protein [Halobaculum sp. DT31]